MTPEQRSQAFAPEEWVTGDEMILVYIVEPEPENWPVLPPDRSRLTRALRLARDCVLLGLVIALCYGLIAGITWGAWRVFS